MYEQKTVHCLLYMSGYMVSRCFEGLGVNNIVFRDKSVLGSRVYTFFIHILVYLYRILYFYFHYPTTVSNGIIAFDQNFQYQVFIWFSYFEDPESKNVIFRNWSVPMHACMYVIVCCEFSSTLHLKN